MNSRPPWLGFNDSDELPEYVCFDGETQKFIPTSTPHNLRQGFTCRARLDIVLTVDGTIVDLNRIPLPKGTMLEDRRFEAKS